MVAAMMGAKSRTASGLAERIVRLRKSRGMTQAELAKAVGVSQANISYYETGVSDPATAVVAELARALGVSTDLLLGIKSEGTKATRDAMDTETRVLWKRFKKMRLLPERDQRAVIRLLNSLATSRRTSDPAASGG